MTRALITLPKSARKGDTFEIRTVVGHPMETGFRPGADGKTLPRNIIERFECHYNNELIFKADLFAAVSANPYIAFHTVATASGSLRFTWTGDQNFVHTETVAFEVT
jgi:sulfur-oxidizing protein SoxZ